jgi:hypothetical protein
MEERVEGRLGRWILLPLVLLALMFFAASLLPPVECGVGGSGGDPGRVAFAVVAGLCSLAVGTAAVGRLLGMRRRRCYRGRDLWLGGLALVALGVGATIGGRNAETALAGGLAAGLLVGVASLAALVGARLLGKSADGVGALLPIYLFGACLTYPLLAWIVLDLNSGGLC